MKGGTVGALLGVIVGAVIAQVAPDDAYQTVFAGRYAVDGACMAPDAMWELGATSIIAGPMACEINEISWTNDGALRVSTRACSRSGVTVRPIAYQFDIVSGDVIKVSDARIVSMLRRCM